MALTPAQRDWMRHSISLDRAVLATNPDALTRIYTGSQLAYLREVADLKAQALQALQAGLTMTAAIQAAADYLLTYADAHLMLDMREPDFYEVMTAARQTLAAALMKARAA